LTGRRSPAERAGRISKEVFTQPRSKNLREGKRRVETRKKKKEKKSGRRETFAGKRQSFQITERILLAKTVEGMPFT